jgi:hypothetical protein
VGALSVIQMADDLLAEHRKQSAHTSRNNVAIEMTGRLRSLREVLASVRGRYPRSRREASIRDLVMPETSAWFEG